MDDRWLSSDLVIGEELRIPVSLFVSGESAAERLISAKFVGETPSGIMIECNFRPGVLASEPDKWRYRMMINWATIWCGQRKIYRSNGTTVRANRRKPQVIIREVEE